MMLVLCWALPALIGIYFYIKPQLWTSAPCATSTGYPMKVYSRDGELISQFGEIRRIPAAGRNSQSMIDASCTRHRRCPFYEHPGIDPIGIIRAATVWAVSGPGASGRQYHYPAGGPQLLPEQREDSCTQDQGEVFLAWRIEQNLSKGTRSSPSISTRSLGYRALGSARPPSSRLRQEVKDPTLDEIAIIAGLPKAPSMLNPIRSLGARFARRNVVLGRMLETGKITQAQYDEAPRCRSRPVSRCRNYAERPLSERDGAPEDGGAVCEDAYTMGLRLHHRHRQSVRAPPIRRCWTAVFDYDTRHGYRPGLPCCGKPVKRPGTTSDHGPSGQAADPSAPGWPPWSPQLGDKSATLGAQEWQTGRTGLNGIKWARAFITDDRQGFCAPKSARGCARKVPRSGQGKWEELLLSQIPEAQTPPWWP